MSQANPEFDNNKIPIQKLWQVILASSVGTVIEWYDFYIFGSLSAIMSLSFFPKDDPTAAFLSTLAAFGAAAIVYPTRKTLLQYTTTSTELHRLLGLV